MSAKQSSCTSCELQKYYELYNSYAPVERPWVPDAIKSSPVCLGTQPTPDATGPAMAGVMASGSKRVPKRQKDYRCRCSQCVESSEGYTRWQALLRHPDRHALLHQECVDDSNHDSDDMDSPAYQSPDAPQATFEMATSVYNARFFTPTRQPVPSPDSPTSATAEPTGMGAAD